MSAPFRNDPDTIEASTYFRGLGLGALADPRGPADTLAALGSASRRALRAAVLVRVGASRVGPKGLGNLAQALAWVVRLNGLAL